MARAIARHLASTLLLLASWTAYADEPPAPPQPAQPEEAEVLIPPDAESGGWGAPIVQLSRVRDRAAVLAGGRGGWLIARRLTIGGGGCGLVTRIPAPPALQSAAGDNHLQLGYGGLWLEYAVQPLRFVHFTFGTLIGGGGLVLQENGSTLRDDQFFVLEPTAAVELNVSRSVRADLGVAYRWIVGARMPGVSQADVSGVSLVAVVKFGTF
jgi:hypothetical protein